MVRYRKAEIDASNIVSGKRRRPIGYYNSYFVRKNESVFKGPRGGIYLDKGKRKNKRYLTKRQVKTNVTTKRL